MAYGAVTLGSTSGSSSQAGAINGVGLLGTDLTRLAADATRIMGSVTFDASKFRRITRDAERRPGEDEDDYIARLQQRFERMSADEVKQFIAGTVGQVAGAVVRAKQLAMLPVSSTAERDANHAAQAAVIDPARDMWQAAASVLNNARVAQSVSGATGGLGFAPVPVIIAIAAVGAILGVAAIAALTYWSDANMRLEWASQETDRICAAQGGCDADQAARIRATLRLGPWDEAARSFGEAAGRGLTAAIAVGAAATVLAGGGYLLYRKIRKDMNG